MEQFHRLTEHADEIRASVVQFRKNQFSNKASGPNEGEPAIEGICLKTVVELVKSTFPFSTDMNDRALIKELVDSAMNDLKLSTIFTCCLDRNRSGLADFKLSDVERVVKKFYTDAGQKILTDSIYNE